MEVRRLVSTPASPNGEVHRGKHTRRDGRAYQQKEDAHDARQPSRAKLDVAAGGEGPELIAWRAAVSIDPTIGPPKPSL